MDNLYKLLRLVYFIAVLFTLSGCKKLLDIDPPRNERPSEVVFSAVETAKAALSGAYSTLSQSTTYSLNLTVSNALAADELRAVSGTARYAALQNNTYEAFNSSYTSDMWTDSYTSIYQFNSIIIGLSNNTAVNAAVSKQIVAEAKTMRAYCYLQLTRLFGDVPLVLTTNVDQTALTPRISTNTVYAQIIQDLTEAKADLAVEYVSNAGVANRMQANKSTASALLAIAYLTTGNTSEAISNASEIIDNTGLYQLLPGGELDDVFLANSKEAILQFGSAQNATTGYTNEGQAFISGPFSFSLSFTLSNSLLNAFEPNDLRKKAWVRQVTMNGVTATEPYKYKNYDRESATVSQRFEVPTVIRLAEIYLIRAEAYALSGNRALAIADVQTIRNRAGLTDLPSSVNIDDAILQERRVELFCERGDRWLSLKRTGKINSVLAAAKPATWQSFAQFYPIPQTAIDSNPNLTQNQGYR